MRLKDSTPFPDEVAPEVRATFKKAADTITPLAMRILRAMAVSLGLDKEFFVDRHTLMFDEGSTTAMRAVYYPAIKGKCSN